MGFFFNLFVDSFSMRKKMRRASLQVQKKDDQNLEDRISLLPDEILVIILSFLSLKEAAVTSILSRRWRDVWAFTTCLDFDGSETLEKIAINEFEGLLELERNKYVNWVNHVVGLHKGRTVELVRVCFDLDKSSKRYIDKWLKFALARKRVHRLVLDLSEYDGRDGIRCVKPYNFPDDILGQVEVEGTSLNNLSSNISTMNGCSFVGFKSLKEVCLYCVNVSGDVLEYFLSKCPVLERLCVRGSFKLVHFKVVGPSLVLKYLEIGHCYHIESMEISNVNLVALRYEGRKISLLLENVPLLVELFIGDSASESLNELFPRLSCCRSQLETLEVGTGDWEIKWCDPSISKRKVRKAERCSHQHLEEVEISGYYGRKTDLELVIYFLENAVALKKIIIDHHDQLAPEFPMEIDELEEEEAAGVRAEQQLRGRVPAGIELVLI